MAHMALQMIYKRKSIILPNWKVVIKLQTLSKDLQWHLSQLSFNSWWDILLDVCGFYGFTSVEFTTKAN